MHVFHLSHSQPLNMTDECRYSALALMTPIGDKNFKTNEDVKLSWSALLVAGVVYEDLWRV